MLRKLRELREKYGPLYRLMERGGRLAEFVKSRSLLKKAFEGFKPDLLDLGEFRETPVEVVRNAEQFQMG